jgi:glycosyltransferase involved in cell wall biosynthesis
LTSPSAEYAPEGRIVVDSGGKKLSESQPTSRPLVSIITVSFNSAHTIREAIESVMSQDYPSIEYLVIDGGSTDGTVEIVRGFGDRIDTFVSEPDRGIYDAMNKGIRLARGSIVGMLNSDDAYTDNRSVSDLVEAMLRESTDSAFGDVIYVDRQDADRVVRHYRSGRWSPRRFRFGWMPAHPTFFVKREWYERCGLFSLDYRIAADFEMLVRLLYVAKVTYTYVGRPMVRMRSGGASASGWSNSLAINREIVRACRNHGIWTGLPLMALKVPEKLLEMRVDRRTLRRAR